MQFWVIIIMFLNCHNVFEKVPSDMDVALPLKWCLRTQQDQTVPDGYVRGETNFWVMFYIFVFNRVFIQTARQMQKVTKPNNFERVVELDILMFRHFEDMQGFPSWKTVYYKCRLCHYYKFSSVTKYNSPSLLSEDLVGYRIVKDT